VTHSTTPRQPFALIVLSLVLFGGLLVIGVVLLDSSGAASPAPTAAPRPTNTPDFAAGAQIIPINPPQTLTDFSGIDGDGSPIALTDLRGKWTLLYFGYVNCPDFCPLTLAEFVQVKTLLGDAATQFNFVLVSIDPERDTPDDIRAYVASFDPSFIGIQAELDALRPIEAEYGLTVITPQPGATPAHTMPGMPDMNMPMTAIDGGYLIDHTTYSYLIDPDGALRSIISFNTPAEAVVAEYQRVSASN
jgi:protein SCO1/2